MTASASEANGSVAVLRDQLASFRPLLALSMMMTNSRDEDQILGIAATTVPSLGGCRAEAVRVDDDWRAVGPVGRPDGADGLADQLSALGNAAGPVDVAGAAWAYPLGNQAELFGHLVVSCAAELDPHHQFLLNVLVQQTGVALSSARLHTQDGPRSSGNAPWPTRPVPPTTPWNRR